MTLRACVNSSLRLGLEIVATNKIKPEFIPIYTVSDSLDEAWEHVSSQLPITNINDLKGLLMNYHNTLVVEQEKENGNHIK